MPFSLSSSSRTCPRRGWRILVLMPLTALALSGCAQRWAKPGASDADFRIAQIRCETKGYERLPPDLQWMQITSGYTTHGHRSCWKSRGQKRCETKGYERLPPDLQWMQITSGYTTHGHRSCWKSRGKKRCSDTPGRYVPPSFGHVDRNGPLRERLLSSCLVDDGWRPTD